MDPWRLLRVTLDAIGAHARHWATLLLTFALFAYAAYRPETLRIVAATLFALIVHVPLWMGGRHALEKAQRTERDRVAAE